MMIAHNFQWAPTYTFQILGNLQIDFGSQGLVCPEFTPIEAIEDLAPWFIDPIVTNGDANFVAVIGPAGRQRGYQGITGNMFPWEHRLWKTIIFLQILVPSSDAFCLFQSTIPLLLYVFMFNFIPQVMVTCAFNMHSHK